MGQDLYKNIRALSTEDDYVIDNALTDQWRHRIMGLRLSLERLKVSLLDLSDFATWQGAIKLLQELLELQPVICRFNDISLKLPEDIKQAWEALTENVNLEAVHSGRSLRYFLQELVSALPWGSDSESQWVRTDHFERTVIIRPHEEFVIYVMLHEEWDCQVSIFTSTFDDIVAEEYRGWDERGDWEYIRMMLEDLQELQQTIFRFDGTKSCIKATLEEYQRWTSTIRAITTGDTEGSTQCALLDSLAIVCTRIPDFSTN